MFETLPGTAREAMNWEWPQYAPYVQNLLSRELNTGTVDGWLADWSRFGKLVEEVYGRLFVATTVDTTDKEIEARFYAFLDNIFPEAEKAADALNRKLLDSGLQPDGFEIPLRNIRAKVELFRAENLPLQTEENKLGTEYDKVIGAQTVQWDGQEMTLPQLRPLYQNPARAVRERAWRLGSDRQLADRAALNNLWDKFLKLRLQMAANADCADYRAYKWRQMLRFDYTPDDCDTFHRAIEQVVVPAAERLYEKRRKRLGVDSLRPWDLNVDPLGRPPLKPFRDVSELVSRCAAIFNRVDPQLGAYFQTMRDENLLDLDNRKGKAPGGYCHTFPLAARPFIFMNAVGLHDDVQTLLHEGGHAFHAFEATRLPYHHQTEAPMEFNEVASMAMELLAAPYLPASEGGFYSADDAARARVEHLESMLMFWPYMAVVDAFQHWVYTHPVEAADPAQCDAQWAALWKRFMKGIDYTGLEDAMMTGWHRKLHIFQVPFYYVEYGLAQLGAAQVWAHALEDPQGALAGYRKALSLGGTVSLPQLFETAGAKFAFDAGTMAGTVSLIEYTIDQLDPA